jgi:acyl-coenzyme A synthetase/AMP-(fatty) acid ligase
MNKNNFILNNTNSKEDIEILNFISNVESEGSLLFTTSGTTGENKKVYHTVESLKKNIKVKDELKNVVWGLTYDPNKIAGALVLLQAYFNNGKIVNLFNKSTSNVVELIKKYNVTHLSATPTFYRLLAGQYIFDNVRQVTLGGEVVDETVINLLKKFFPVANIKNIYALTEFGSIIASDSEIFEITNKNEHYLKIIDNHIFIKKFDEWINTYDVVEPISPNKFKIIGRENIMINVGGVKVNPIKVENVINSIPMVKNSHVYSRKNSVMGNVVVADIVLEKEKNLSVREIQKFLNEQLTSYERPIKLNIVENIPTNSNGKIIRTI